MRNRFAVSRCCCSSDLPIPGEFATWSPGVGFYDVFSFWTYSPNSSSQQGYSGFANWVPEFGAYTNGISYGLFRQRVDLAQGTTISSATLELFKSTINTANLTALPVPVGIWVWNGDSAIDSIGLFNPPSPPTAPENTWSPPYAGTWFPRINLTVTTNHNVDITSQIQTVLNRPGWVSGNFIAIAIVTDYITATPDPLGKTWYGNWDESVMSIGPGANEWIRNYVRITL